MEVKGNRVQYNEQKPSSRKNRDNGQHLELFQLAGQWLKKHSKNIIVPNCSTVVVDMVTAVQEIPDVLGWCSWCSVMIEVKVSRTDFLKDAQKSFRINPSTGVGNLRYYLCPVDLINANEIPENWGLLYVTPNNKIEIIQKATQQKPNLTAERTILLSLINRINCKL